MNLLDFLVLRNLVNMMCSSVEHQIFKDGSILLFQGDSITDAGRERKWQAANSPRSMGSGYSFLVAAYLLTKYPERKLQIYNRGINNERLSQVAQRWSVDCLELRPDILSILVGFNDYWHLRRGEHDGTVERFESDYKELLDRTLNANPETKLVICQPFIVVGAGNVSESWVGPFGEYQDAVKRVSDAFGAIWVPFQEAYDSAMQEMVPNYLATDGIHPTIVGANLMAKAWLSAIN